MDSNHRILIQNQAHYPPMLNGILFSLLREARHNLAPAHLSEMQARERDFLPDKPDDRPDIRCKYTAESFCCLRPGT